jgi:hypothetical protein
MLAEASNDSLLRFLPLLVICVIIVWLMATMMRISKRSKPLHDRSLAHMDRIEAKTDEMVALLAEIRDRLPPSE